MVLVYRLSLLVPILSYPAQCILDAVISFFFPLMLSLLRLLSAALWWCSSVTQMGLPRLVNKRDVGGRHSFIHSRNPFLTSESTDPGGGRM